MSVTASFFVEPTRVHFQAQLYEVPRVGDVINIQGGFGRYRVMGVSWRDLDTPSPEIDLDVWPLSTREWVRLREHEDQRFRELLLRLEAGGR